MKEKQKDKLALRLVFSKLNFESTLTTETLNIV